MGISADHQQHGDVLAVLPLVRRVVAARVHDPQAVDDLVQETLARLLEARPRLDGQALAPFAVVLARNVAVSFVRSEHTASRHLHRLVDPREPERPEEQALQREEAQAVAAGLARLPAPDRTALLAHEVKGADTASIAEELGSTPAAVAAQLARARAKLRVNYLVAMRRVDLPSDRCRSILNALSAGDRRRQRGLDAGAHLLDCQVCAALSEPLVERRRSLAAFLPSGLTQPVQTLRGWLHDHPAQAATGAGALTLAALVAVLLAVGHRDGPPASVAPPGTAAVTDRTLLADGEAILPLSGRPPLAHYAGRRVQGTAARVQLVAADEGFWVGGAAPNRVWVRLTGTRESPFRVRAGQRVSFSGRMVANPPRFAADAGVDAAEGAALLERQGYHIEVAAARLRVA
jgi:RNA polymerase sigma factor (sigma-70 family)